MKHLLFGGGRAVFFSATNDGGGADAAKEATAAEGTAAEQQDAAPGLDKDKLAEAVPELKYSEKDIEELKTNLSKENQASIIAAVSDALKKSKMSPEELVKHEDDTKAAALETREKEIFIRELKAETLVKLDTEKLPKDIINIVLGADQQATEENIKNFKLVFDKAVKEQVIKQLAGKTPPAGNADGKNNDGGILEGFRKGMGV